MKKYNIAIIGLGYWGTIVTNTIISMNLFDKVYINDTDISKINILKKKFGKKVTEIDFDKIDKIKGLDICITTSAKNNEEAMELFKQFNFPFK